MSSAISEGIGLYAPRDGSFFELRVLDIPSGNRTITASGYFNDPGTAAEAVARYDGRGAIFMTLNPVQPGVEARALDRIQENPKNTTGDAEIACRHRLLFDFDPKRPSGISATDAEHDAAIDLAKRVATHLRDEYGWPNPALIDSGNGAHLIYHIGLPNDDPAKALVKGVLEGIAFLFGDDVVEVDLTVYNAGRIVKVPGTIAKKGDNTPARPHRRSAILLAGKTAAVVTRTQLEEIAASCPADEPRAARQGRAHGESLDPLAFCQQHAISVRLQKPWNGGTVYVLDACVFDSSHTGSSAVIGQFAGGAVYYKCQHNSCAGYAWADVREKFEPRYRERFASNEFSTPWPNGIAPAPSVPSAPSDEPPEWEPAYPWPTLDAAALHGLAGDTIRAIAPETEADSAAMLFTLLAEVGNVLGADACARVGDERHPGRLFVAIVGDTAAGAKGTSEAAIRPIVRAAFPEWFESRQFAGFGSGEAVVKEYEDEATDRRGFILEPEFARVLTAAGRDGSTLSPILRQAWDGGTLACRRAKDRIVARGVHLSAVAHITPTELRAKLAEGDMLNGFGNRFLPVVSRRSKKLPSGGHVDPAVIGQLAKRLSSVIRPIHKTYSRTPEAEVLWAKMYLAEPDRDGTVGALTARAHAQRLRLSVIYAALDGATVIRPEHLRAADACWRYAVQSVEHIFGGLRGDRVQDQLLAALRNAWPEGLTGADQAGIFAKSLRPGQIAEARAELERHGLIRTESRPSPSAKGGRPTVRTYAIPRPNQPNQPLTLEVNSVNSVDSAPENGIEDEPDTYAVPRTEQTEHPPVLEVFSVDSALVEHEDNLPSEVRV